MHTVCVERLPIVFVHMRSRGPEPCYNKHAFMQLMQCGCSPPGPLAFRWNCMCGLTTKHLVHCRSETVTSPFL